MIPSSRKKAFRLPLACGVFRRDRKRAIEQVSGFRLSRALPLRGQLPWLPQFPAGGISTVTVLSCPYLLVSDLCRTWTAPASSRSIAKRFAAVSTNAPGTVKIGVEFGVLLGADTRCRPQSVSREGRV